MEHKKLSIRRRRITAVNLGEGGGRALGGPRSRLRRAVFGQGPHQRSTPAHPAPFHLSRYGARALGRMIFIR
jgi:hypothetical protein